eukprot:TRINITY_DN6657_c0_g1_i2.p1 TRINITY_DN6657_c0_g1~~TRINITY_DN6657_c0_g1_i2.p1  ORF type:complete len:1408 (+),score=258.18 TRINITY_DN6657_c0_g1_i2:46-4224(+)
MDSDDDSSMSASMSSNRSSFLQGDAWRQRSLSEAPFGGRAASPSVIANATHSGWLLKRGAGLIAKFSRRYFILEGHILRYKQNPSAEDSGHIDLSDAAIRQDADRPLEFTIEGQNTARKFILQAVTADDLETWLDVLQKAAGVGSTSLVTASMGVTGTWKCPGLGALIAVTNTGPYFECRCPAAPWSPANGVQRSEFELEITFTGRAQRATLAPAGNNIVFDKGDVWVRVGNPSEFTVYCFENEKFGPKGWSKEKLGRPAWSNSDGRVAQNKHNLVAPRGFEFSGDWKLHTDDADDGGWTYGADWGTCTNQQKNSHDTVRRRLWLRPCMNTVPEEAPEPVVHEPPHETNGQDVTAAVVVSAAAAPSPVPASIPVAPPWDRQKPAPPAAPPRSESSTTAPVAAAAPVPVHRAPAEQPMRKRRRACAKPQTVEVITYENQRWFPVRGFSSKMLPTDRPGWSSADGRIEQRREQMQPPTDYQWESGSAFTIVKDPHTTDAEGWEYAVDFPAVYHGSKSASDFVRRRQWRRQAELIGDGEWEEEPPEEVRSPAAINSYADDIAKAMAEPSAELNDSAPRPQYTEVTTFENERWFPFKGWSNKLLATDRPGWSSIDGKQERRRERLRAPRGYQWDGEWRIRINQDTDKDGWTYAVDFPVAQYAPAQTSLAMVRRREWVRDCCLIQLQQQEQGESALVDDARLTVTDLQPLDEDRASPVEETAEEHQTDIEMEIAPETSDAEAALFHRGPASAVAIEVVPAERRERAVMRGLRRVASVFGAGGDADAAAALQATMMAHKPGTIWYAINKNDLSACLEFAGADRKVLTTAAPDGATPFLQSLVYEHYDIAKGLLNYFPELLHQTYAKPAGDGTQNPYSKQGAYFGQNCLHIAILKRNFELVKFFVDRERQLVRIGKLPSRKLVRGRAEGAFFQLGQACGFGEYPLFFAACMGQRDIFHYLLENNADLFAEAAGKNKLLHVLVYHGRYDMYDVVEEEFKKQGWKFDDPAFDLHNSQQLTPLTLAAEIGKVDMFLHIVAKGKMVQWNLGPVNCNCYPLERIESFSPPGSAPPGIRGPSVLQLIVKHDYENFLDVPLIARIITTKWTSKIEGHFYKRLVHHIIFILYLTIYAWFHRRARGGVADIVLAIPVMFRGLWKLFVEAKQIKHQGIFGYFSEQGSGLFENVVSLLQCFGILFFTLCFISGAYKAECFFLSFVSMMSYTYSLFFFFGFELTGPFAVMIGRMLTTDVIRFAYIFGIFLLGFSTAFSALHSDSEVNPFLMLHNTALAAFGTYDFDVTSSTSLLPFVSSTMLYVWLVLSLILLLNLLIAMLGNTFSQISENAAKTWTMERLRIILAIENELADSEVYSYWMKLDETGRRYFQIEEVQGRDNLLEIKDEEGE